MSKRPTVFAPPGRGCSSSHDPVRVYRISKTQGTSTRCNGRDETAATCGKDGLGVFGSNQTLVQPGGCYVSDP